ncbi:MAG TPA: phospholipase A2 [Candidatus Limnocylindrales bacterium]|nr:phospholipase A2 [Candidatus Limnocylindrales bacterium]
MRLLSRAAVLVLGIAAALTVAAPSTNAGPSTGTWSEAVATIQSLDDGRSALDHVPADFSRVMGYSPQLARLADGSARVINPDGSCSVPGEGHPFDFVVPCQAHDFGYDMLRYAARTHSSLPATAREDIDGRLSSDLHIQCMADRLPTTRASCDATVAVFRAGVGFNTWRQTYDAPDDRSGLPRTAGVVLLGGLGLFGLIPGVRRRLFASAAGSGRRGYRRR